MPEQSFANHTQRAPWLLAAAILLLLALITAVIIIVHGWGNGAQMHNGLALSLLAVGAFIGIGQCRTFVLKVQDRAIRAEENLRHYVLTGKLLDKRLTIKQIVAVRFASDEEFPELARQAAEKGMTPKDIKAAVKNWRPDFHRA
jgi:hypothetical protein